MGTRELSILVFTSLDGVMQSPKLKDEDSSGDFALGGWAEPFWVEVMEQVSEEAMAEPFELLLGRRTYDLFAEHQPTSGSPLSDARKYVVTSSPSGLTWKNSVAITQDVPAAIRTLKDQDGPLLQVHGSSELIQTLLAEDLVDEYRLWTFPIVLGAGKRLFGDGAMPRGLKLRKTAATPGGVVMNIYRPD